MALNVIAQALDGNDLPSRLPTQEAEQDALIQTIAAVQEIQRLKVNVLTGAGAATPIALAGIVTTDTILVALLIKDPGASTTASVIKLTPSIPTDGNVQFVEASNAAAGDRVIVAWYDKI